MRSTLLLLLLAAMATAGTIDFSPTLPTAVPFTLTQNDLAIWAEAHEASDSIAALDQQCDHTDGSPLCIGGVVTEEHWETAPEIIPAPTPEPSSWLLVGSALILVGWRNRR